MTEFFKYGDRDRKSQKYDRKEITLTKMGKTYNVYDAIQAANVDTDIYEVMQKYHCNENDAVEYMKEHGGVQGVYMDIVELQKKITSIADAEQIFKNAKEMFENLPADIKSKYGEDLEGFLTKMQEINEKQNNKKQNEPEPQDENTKKEVTANETK